MKKIERRRLWIASLRVGPYQHAQDAAVGAELEQEIQALLASLEAGQAGGGLSHADA